MDIPMYIQQDATLHILLYLKTALHVSGGVGGFTQTGSNSSTIAADSSNGVTNTSCCRYSCYALLMMGAGTTRNM
jgi:hypothetical protein